MFYYTAHSGGWYKLKSGYYIMAKYCERVSDSEASSYADSDSSSEVYKIGSTGSTVSWIQQRLKDLSLYSGEVTGHYGTKTAAAVEAFQEKRGLTADGIVGSKTMAALQGYDTNSGSASAKVEGDIYDLKWFAAKENGTLNRIGLKRGASAVLTDLRTGKSFNIRVQSAGYHLDVEPTAANDTATMCSIYNVSSASKIKYYRRPMMIQTSEGKKIVCSMYGTPHGQQDITDNNFPGQFCLHFTDSTTSDSKVIRQDHVNAIKEAKEIVEKKTGKSVPTVSSL
ncbi:MAG: peptidoglycan-binding protein [Clostridia bacterium]|nr:peptidoglycan-binding protein [Clostridia bacterium]